MNNVSHTFKRNSSNLQLGFSLIELIIVIIILGILSISVAPKFFSGNGVSEFGYRADVIAKLRLIQTRAMQQGDVECHEVLITAKKLGKGSCSGFVFVDPDMEKKYRGTITSIDDQDLVEFSPKNTSFTFDVMGRPHTNNGNESITINIIGEQTLQVVIEVEGYIHAI